MSVRHRFLKFYRAAQSIIAPGLRYSQSIYESVLNDCVRQDVDWMDLGCGHQLLPPWRDQEERQLTARARRLIGLDFDIDAMRKHRTIRLRVQGDVSRLPFDDETFDVITSNMVFEHLKQPEIQLLEIFRVLRPGGLLIFHTPNRYGYALVAGRLIPGPLKVRLAGWLQDRRSEDVYPTFYRINSERDIASLSERIGFKLRRVRLVVSSANLIMVPPLVVFELLILRILMTKRMRPFRTNIIAVLQRPLPD